MSQKVSAMTAWPAFTGADLLYVVKADGSAWYQATADQLVSALSATNLTSGTVPNARFPATLPAASGVNLTALNATQLTSGTVPTARFPGGAFNGASELVQLTAATKYPGLDGSLITALNASALASGTVADGRLSASVTLQGNAFNGASELLQLDPAGRVQCSLISSDGGESFDLGAPLHRWQNVYVYDTVAWTDGAGTVITTIGADEAVPGLTIYARGINLSGAGGIAFNANSYAFGGSVVNNANPGVGTVARWDAAAPASYAFVTGLVAGHEGEIRLIWNTGQGAVIFNNQDSGSSAANRFLTATGGDVVAAEKELAILAYDSTTARWRVAAGFTLQGNTFNGASQLVQLTAAGKYPALDGSLITSLDAANLGSGTIPTARFPGGAFNGASELVQLDAGGALPVLDGSALTGVAAAPAGSDTQFQFNDMGVAAGTPLLTVDPATFAITVRSHSHLDNPLILFDAANDLTNFVNANTGASILQISHDASQIAFFAVALVAQQTANDALTDSSGGTASTTVENVSDPLGTLGALVGSVNDNFATMAAQFAKLRTLLTAYGLGT